MCEQHVATCSLIKHTFTTSCKTCKFHVEKYTCFVSFLIQSEHDSGYGKKTFRLYTCKAMIDAKILSLRVWQEFEHSTIKESLEQRRPINNHNNSDKILYYIWIMLWLNVAEYNIVHLTFGNIFMLLIIKQITKSSSATRIVPGCFWRSFMTASGGIRSPV